MGLEMGSDLIRLVEMGDEMGSDELRFVEMGSDGLSEMERDWMRFKSKPQPFLRNSFGTSFCILNLLRNPPECFWRISFQAMWPAIFSLYYR